MIWFQDDLQSLFIIIDGSYLFYHIPDIGQEWLLYYLSVLCKFLKERFFLYASRSKADAKVLLISELPKLLENIFEENTENWGKSMEMST